MFREIDYHSMYIQENQKRDSLLAATLNTSVSLPVSISLQSLDSQYSKQHLNTHTDPSPWVDSSWKTCHPATFPCLEGYEYITPWVYIINYPYTDSGGWIYKKSFESEEEYNKNEFYTFVRYRKWKRVCVPIEQVHLANNIEDNSGNNNKINAYNLNFIKKFFNHEIFIEKLYKYSLQMVIENRRIKENDNNNDNNNNNINDPSIWTIYDIPKYMQHKYIKHIKSENYSNINTPNIIINNNTHIINNKYIPATVENLEFNLNKEKNNNNDNDDNEPNFRDYVALCGFNFFIDDHTDDAGWQYSDSFYNNNDNNNDNNNENNNENYIVNHERWDKNYNEKVLCENHTVKRRIWGRILVKYHTLNEIRLLWRKYISDNVRGTIKCDQFYKQGHIRTNWSIRQFELKDYSLLYKTPSDVRGCIDLSNKHVHYNDKIGALLEESGGRCNGFKISREFRYHCYYPIYYEKESRYEVEMLKFANFLKQAAKKSTEIPMYEDQSTSRKYSINSSTSNILSLLSNNNNNNNNNGRRMSFSSETSNNTMKTTTSSSTMSSKDIKELTSYQSQNARPTPILDGYARRMDRGYLNLDTKYTSQRDEWMDILRHQIWLINNSEGDTAASTLHREALAQKIANNISINDNNKNKNKKKEIENFISYRIYDVEGAPPYDNEALQLTITIDMLIPKEYRITHDYLSELPSLYSIYPKNKLKVKLSNTKESRLAKRELKRASSNLINTLSYNNIENNNNIIKELEKEKEKELEKPRESSIVEIEWVSKIPQSKHKWVSAADKDLTNLHLFKPASNKFRAGYFLNKINNKNKDDNKDNNNVETEISNPDTTNETENNEIIEEEIKVVIEEPEVISTDENILKNNLIVHDSILTGILMKKMLFSENAYKLRYIWLSNFNDDNEWRLNWSKSEHTVMSGKYIDMRRITKCVTGTKVPEENTARIPLRGMKSMNSVNKSFRRLSMKSFTTETENYDEDRQLIILYKAISNNNNNNNNNNNPENAAGGLYLKTKSVQVTSEWVQTINNIIQMYAEEEEKYKKNLQLIEVDENNIDL